jgi:hypothetical protein
LAVRPRAEYLLVGAAFEVAVVVGGDLLELIDELARAAHRGPGTASVSV